MNEMIETYKFKWRHKLLLLNTVLTELHKRPEVLKDWEITDLIRPEQVEIVLCEWLVLYEKLDGIEKDFYKEHWIPGEYNSLGYFIDLSTEQLSMRADYYQFKYHGWVPFRKVDLCDILLNNYSESDISEIRSEFITKNTIPRELELKARFEQQQKKRF